MGYVGTEFALPPEALIETVKPSNRGVPDDERDLIVSGNAARVWNL